MLTPIVSRRSNRLLGIPRALGGTPVSWEFDGACHGTRLCTTNTLTLSQHWHQASENSTRRRQYRLSLASSSSQPRRTALVSRCITPGRYFPPSQRKARPASKISMVAFPPPVEIVSLCPAPVCFVIRADIKHDKRFLREARQRNLPALNS